MKGNEARGVFFLHPVDQVRDGKVAKVKPLKNSLGVVSLLLPALLLGLGVLIYLFLDLEADPSQQERREWKVTTTTTTTAMKTSTMDEPATTGSTIVTSEKPGENKSSTESGKIV